MEKPDPRQRRKIMRTAAIAAGAAVGFYFLIYFAGWLLAP